MKKLVILLILAALIPSVLAQSGSIKLLAVSELGNGTYTGSVVDLHLEVKEGEGRVFIDSFPFTKLDTQITTRTAKQIACDYADRNCNVHDFFYTINSSASIVGGPSAGAATAVLTVAVLEGLPLNSSIAITGTINAGNIIGTVGGLKEKIRAASENGIEKVIIPAGSSIIEVNNETINLTEYGRKWNISVQQSPTLGKALETFTGKKIKEPEKNYSVSPVYLSTMKSISKKLCDRSTEILADVLQENYAVGNVLDNKSVKLEQDVNDLVAKAREAMREGFYYSVASYCYGAGLRNTQISIIEDNLTFDEMNSVINKLQSQLEDYEKLVDEWEINTITDLESYMIVKERLYDARKNIEDFKKSAEKEDYDGAVLELASVISRFSSAKSWSAFHSKGGKPIDIDKSSLKLSCKQKLAEAEERFQYVNFYFPGIISRIRLDINEALSNYGSENYAMCLFLATKAKADIDSVATTIGAGEADFDFLINQRLEIAREAIAEQHAQGAFPIIGYSYYEYALDLLKNNETGTKATALVYTGYALELSRLDIYFEKRGIEFRIDSKRLSYLLIFFGGFVVGILVYDVLTRSRKGKSKKRRKRK